MFADWWKDKTDQDVPELDSGSHVIRPQELMQKTLFETKEVKKGG
jgi:hypothetical protein